MKSEKYFVNTAPPKEQKGSQEWLERCCQEKGMGEEEEKLLYSI